MEDWWRIKYFPPGVLGSYSRGANPPWPPLGFNTCFNSDVHFIYSEQNFMTQFGFLSIPDISMIPCNYMYMMEEDLLVIALFSEQCIILNCVNYCHKEVRRLEQYIVRCQICYTCFSTYLMRRIQKWIYFFPNSFYFLNIHIHTTILHHKILNLKKIKENSI